MPLSKCSNCILCNRSFPADADFIQFTPCQHYRMHPHCFLYHIRHSTTPRNCPDCNEPIQSIFFTCANRSSRQAISTVSEFAAQYSLHLKAGVKAEKCTQCGKLMARNAAGGEKEEEKVLLYPCGHRGAHVECARKAWTRRLEKGKKIKCRRLMCKKEVGYVWVWAPARGIAGEFMTAEEFMKSVEAGARSAGGSAAGITVGAPR